MAAHSLCAIAAAFFWWLVYKQPSNSRVARAALSTALTLALSGAAAAVAIVASTSSLELSGGEMYPLP